MAQTKQLSAVRSCEARDVAINLDILNYLTEWFESTSGKPTTY